MYSIIMLTWCQQPGDLYHSGNDHLDYTSIRSCDASLFLYFTHRNIVKKSSDCPVAARVTTLAVEETPEVLGQLFLASPPYCHSDT